MTLYQVTQERKRVPQGTRVVKSLWLDAPTHEAANREFRARHRLAPNDWVMVKDIEHAVYKARIFHS